MRPSTAILTICAAIALYAVIWHELTPLGRAEFERYAVAACMVVATVMYSFVGISIIWARKTALNIAFAAKHIFWGLLVVLLAMPNAIGVIVHSAPYQLNTPHNPYSLYTVPASVRTAIWIGIALSAAAVIWEFYETNWDGPVWRPVPRWKQTDGGTV